MNYRRLFYKVTNQSDYLELTNRLKKMQVSNNHNSGTHKGKNKNITMISSHDYFSSLIDISEVEKNIWTFELVPSLPSNIDIKVT